MEGLVADRLATEEGTLRLPARRSLALRTVRRAPEPDPTALAERLGVGRPTASRLWDRLEASATPQAVP
ncbi:hypothetical protein ACFYO5_16495 [Streptomyces sp. NPDC006259]|uniref:hypothetical protein n=1 Tax=Streptomyces sp. NPDC006259 TaxID=3364740 RepID=UPI0036CAE83B